MCSELVMRFAWMLDAVCLAVGVIGDCQGLAIFPSRLAILRPLRVLLYGHVVLGAAMGCLILIDVLNSQTCHECWLVGGRVFVTMVYGITPFVFHRAYRRMDTQDKRDHDGRTLPLP